LSFYGWHLPPRSPPPRPFPPVAPTTPTTRIPRPCWTRLPTK